MNSSLELRNVFLSYQSTGKESVVFHSLSVSFPESYIKFV